MKISIITVVYNRAATIRTAIESVIRQQDVNIEFIIVDGNSTDGTDQVIKGYGKQIQQYIREPDDGIYDALNKGIRAATGDAIGFIHADDFLADDFTLNHVAGALGDPDVDGVYGDLVYVSADSTDRVQRYWQAGGYNPGRFRFGWMPPHPTVYMKRACYEQFGHFNLEMKTAADYELMLRMMVKHRIRMKYIPEVMVKMRSGGASNASIRNRLRANRDDQLAWSMNGLRAPWGLRFMKPLRKIGQFFKRAPLPAD